MPCMLCVITGTCFRVQGVAYVFMRLQFVDLALKLAGVIHD